VNDVRRGADFSSSFYCVHSKNLCYKTVQNINVRSPRTNVFSDRNSGNIHLNYEQRGKKWPRRNLTMCTRVLFVYSRKEKGQEMYTMLGLEISTGWEQIEDRDEEGG